MNNPEIQKIKNSISDILKSYGVKKAGLFGSIVRNEQTVDSDIDLLVEFGSGKSLLDLIGLKLDLEDFLHRKVDVLTYKSLHPLLKDKILEEQEVIFG
jgi:predicted nucleotidyltransferase